MELLATKNSHCSPDVLYDDVANTEPLNNTLDKKLLYAKKTPRVQKR